MFHQGCRITSSGEVTRQGYFLVGELGLSLVAPAILFTYNAAAFRSRLFSSPWQAVTA